MHIRAIASKQARVLLLDSREPSTSADHTRALPGTVPPVTGLPLRCRHTYTHSSYRTLPSRLVARMVRRRLFTFLPELPGRYLARLLSVGTSDNTRKTMPYSCRDAQDTEITFKFAGRRHRGAPDPSTGHGRGAYVSVSPRPGRPSMSVPWTGQMGGVWNSMPRP